MRIRTKLFAGVAALVCAASVTAGCSNDSGGGGGKSVTLSGQNFTEMQIMAEMYKQLLENAGYSVDTKLVATRDIYLPQMSSGDVDVVPEYLGGLTDALNIEENGDNAAPISSPSPAQTIQALQPLAEKNSITLGKPAKAQDYNAFAVTSAYAQQHNLSTLSDLGNLGQPVVLAAAPDCKGRSDCEGGLSRAYGINITKILPLGFGTTQAIEAVQSGEAQLVEVASTQSNVAENHLTILADDKNIQPAQNLIPAFNEQFAKDNPDAVNALNKLAPVLTSTDLQNLAVQVDIQRQDPADVAESYLKSKGLI